MDTQTKGWLLGVTLGALVSGGPAAAATTGGPGTVSAVRGTVTLLRGGDAQTARVGSGIDPGDTLKTAADAEAQALFPDRSSALLAHDTALRYDGGSGAPTLSLLIGGVRREGGAGPAALNTPFGNVRGLRNADYSALVCRSSCPGEVDGLHVQVFRGSVELQNDSGLQRIGAGGTGFIAAAAAGSRPAAPSAVDPTPNAVAANSPELAASNSNAATAVPATPPPSSTASTRTPPTRESSASPSTPGN